MLKPRAFFIFALLMIILVLSNNAVLFNLTYIFISLAFIINKFSSIYKIKDRIFLIVVYAMIFVFQSVYINLIAFSEKNDISLSIMYRIIGSIIALTPFIIDGVINKNSRIKQFLPSIEDLKVFTFYELAGNIKSVNEIIAKGKKTLSKKNIDEILKDLPRHNSFRYINKGSLTENYFEQARKTLDDRNLYIVISNTGNPASELISMFTHKQYNHASLSFDKELKTIVSYNGGEKIYPPGLNMEMLKFFNKKNDASILVYSVPISPEKKSLLIDKIADINKQGNAYNMLGLMFKFSFRSNIMFCSQFVYKMLKLANLNYFEKDEAQIKPTDLVELDYERKLHYEYKIIFNEKTDAAEAEEEIDAASVS